MSGDYTTTCTIEVPPSFCDELNASLGVTLLEVPAYKATNIINHNQSYVVRVAVELGARIKKLLCGEWCISVAVEGIGPAKEFRLVKVLDMNNCDPNPDTVDFELPGTMFEGEQTDHCGDVFYIVITVVARDKCEHKPIGIAGFCKLGPVMVY